MTLHLNQLTIKCAEFMLFVVCVYFFLQSFMTHEVEELIIVSLLAAYR